jgi:hypothetical protein
VSIERFVKEQILRQPPSTVTFKRICSGMAHIYGFLAPFLSRFGLLALNTYGEDVVVL